MKIFRNGVGRPSNETLRKRKISYVVMLVVLITVMIVSGYFIVTKFSDLNSNRANIKGKPVVPNVLSYTNSKRTKRHNGSWTGGNVYVVASSGTYAGLTYYYEIKKDERVISSNKKGNVVTIKDEGERYIRFKACYKNACSGFSSWNLVRIDKTPPKITFSPSKTGTYVQGKSVVASCVDSGSGLASIKAWFTQNPSTSKTSKFSSAVNVSKSRSIAIKAVGRNKTVTAVCVDAVGNSIGNKVSSSFTITKNTASSNISSK